MLKEHLESYKNELISYVNHVTDMLDCCFKGINEKNKAILKEVIKVKETTANKFENQLEKEGIAIIAVYQPRAKNLREILMLLKMNDDLERIADHSVNIAESFLFLLNIENAPLFEDINKMGESVIKMIQDTINALMREDNSLASSVITRDDEIDNLNKKIIKEVVPIMNAKPSTIESALHIIRISHNLERIGDLTTNLCEDIVYITSGKNLKHKKILT